MWDFLEHYFGGRFMPHGHCYLWTPTVVWTEVASNALIGVAYLSISAFLAYLVWRAKLPFSWVYIAFGTFILACALTHFLDVITVWEPIYWADAGVRVVTAMASVGTAVLVFPLVPRIVALSQLSGLAQERDEKVETAVAQLEQALTDTTRYRLLVDSVKDATFMLDRVGKVVSWNGGAERIKGYTAAEILGRSVEVFLAEEERRVGRAKSALDVAARDGVFEEEAWRVRKDGSRFWASVSLTAMRNALGEVVGFAKVVRDLTERMEQEKKLRELAAENARLAEHALVQDFQERFLAILGHDLRNPLAAIEMGTTLLKNRPDNAPAVDRILTRIETSSTRMSRMIDQILDLTRSRLAGGLEVHPVRMDLCVTLNGIVDELRTANPSRTIELRCAAVAGVWDRDRLEQVFSNLVGNAIQHGAPEQPVTVEARLEGDTVKVRVHNKGDAIAPEAQRHIFSAFRRGTRDSRTSRTAGLGLGLYISRQIVLTHGGELEVESGPDIGTTFAVTLPRASGSTALRPREETR